MKKAKNLRLLERSIIAKKTNKKRKKNKKKKKKKKVTILSFLKLPRRMILELVSRLLKRKETNLPRRFDDESSYIIIKHLDITAKYKKW